MSALSEERKKVDDAQKFFSWRLKEYDTKRIKRDGTLAILLGNGNMADRRPLNPGVVVPKPGGGTQPRDRNNDGRVREKRSDAGKPRK
ncbi:hypothetical protein ACN5LY_002010 [Cronobacter dublinensis]|uniref:hypothetical protein n=1 Tax=Cronobacter dublinensis TaxID=413497 RepID=UPI0024AEF873|nr:hypothetical protein [Cronobacter dublinensis]MDI7503721.1 hypothetical protein [Cronobacter dublinensis]